jgi:serine/threonine protein kinase/Tfp pilus assembly protein PilF
MIGKIISHYKIIEELGRGGMGIVYKTQDLKLDRYVALKFLPSHLTTRKEEKQRFIHEAKAASSLDHNNICNIYEIDETEDGQLFISMAYYEGKTLDDRIKVKPLPFEEAIDIAIQIAQGLAKAHEKEIVHRDIKPANIMLTEEGVVKVLDFGLAKLSTHTKLTKESTTLGTVSYMSPEQAKGEDVDYRTDIWSLGVILYEMLTVQLPFKGEYESAVIYSIMNDTHEPVTGLRTGIPMELERIINKCLQKSTGDRYQHVDELIVDLQGVRKQTESTIAPTVKEPPKKRSKHVLMSVAILSIFILIVAGYFILIQPGEKTISEWENSIAVLPFVNISNDPEQEYFCDGMTEQIISNLAKLPRLKVIARTSVLKYKKTEKTIPEIGRELNVAHILEGSIRKFGNRIRVTAQLIKTNNGFHVWSEDFDKEYQELFDVQDDVSEAIAMNLLDKLSMRDITEIKTNRPNNTEAYEYYIKGKYFHDKFWSSFREEDWRTSEEMYKKAIILDPNFADSYAGLADVYNSFYNWYATTNEEKDKYMQLQETYLDTAFNLDSNSAEVYMVKGWIHEAKNEFAETFESLKRAIEINHNHEGAYNALGDLYTARGLHNLSIKFYSKVIELNPLSPSTYQMRGYSYHLIREYDRAEIEYRRALEIDPNEGAALYRLARLLIERNRYDEANEMYAKFRNLYPDGGKYRRFLKASLYAVNGERDKALSINLGGRAKLRIYLLLKMSEESIQYLNEDFERKKKLEESWYLRLKNHQLYDFLHSDPRFQKMLAKHKEIYEENLEKYGDIDI